MSCRHLLLLAVTVLIGLGGAGCGNAEEDAFKDDYKPLNADLIDLGNRLGDAIGSASDKSDTQVANEFGALSEDLDRLNGKLKALDPPSELKDELRDLNDGLDEAVDSLEGIEAAARARKAAKARTETARFVAISRDINEAQNKLADATGADKGAS